MVVSSSFCPPRRPLGKERGMTALRMILLKLLSSLIWGLIDTAIFIPPAASTLPEPRSSAGATDVSSYNPFRAMQRAVTRIELGMGHGPLNIDERIPIGTAIDAYTIKAAFAMKQDATTGSLEVGKRADLVILDRDILLVDSEAIGDTVVLATYLDGCLVHSAMLGALWDERDSCIRERFRRY
jgi:hypothetical protein